MTIAIYKQSKISSHHLPQGLKNTAAAAAIVSIDGHIAVFISYKRYGILIQCRNNHLSHLTGADKLSLIHKLQIAIFINMEIMVRALIGRAVYLQRSVVNGYRCVKTFSNSCL